MSPALRKLYIECRKHNTGGIVGEYAIWARRDSITIRKWDALESLGLVRFRTEPDPEGDEPDSVGVVAEFLAPHDARATLDVQPQQPYFPIDRWQCGPSLWGCAGYRDATDWRENGYITGMMAETIAAFRHAWKAWIAVNRPTPSECAIPPGMLTSARVRRVCESIGDACGITWESAFSIASAIGAKNHDFTGRTPVEMEDFRAATELLSRVTRGNLCTKSQEHS